MRRRLNPQIVQVTQAAVSSCNLKKVSKWCAKLNKDEKVIVASMVHALKGGRQIID
jgi:hypothetical protein